MGTSKSFQLPPEPPPTIAAALRGRLAGRELQLLGTVFDLRSTAQLLANAITEWMADSAASPARFQILMLIWAAKGRGVPHKEIVATQGVTRATISGLMSALERDGLVTSAVASDDRRNLLASLTAKGEAMIERALEGNKSRLRAAFATMSADELTTLGTLLQRVREGITAGAQGSPGKSARKRARAT